MSDATFSPVPSKNTVKDADNHVVPFLNLDMMAHEYQSPTFHTLPVQRFPSHVVTTWLGNSVKVAEDFYLQTTDEHFT